MRRQIDKPVTVDMRRLKQLRHFERSTQCELDRLNAGDAQYVALAELVTMWLAQVMEGQHDPATVADHLE